VDEEVRNLERTLKNIDEARPFDDLTVVSIYNLGRLGEMTSSPSMSQDDVVAARPDIDARTEQLVSKGRWMVPGYKVCTGLFISCSVEVKVICLANKLRKNSEIFRCFEWRSWRSALYSITIPFSCFCFIRLLYLYYYTDAVKIELRMPSFILVDSWNSRPLTHLPGPCSLPESRKYEPSTHS
jgi:hypothetical protein